MWKKERARSSCKCKSQQEESTKGERDIGRGRKGGGRAREGKRGMRRGEGGVGGVGEEEGRAAW